MIIRHCALGMHHPSRWRHDRDRWRRAQQHAAIVVLLLIHLREQTDELERRGGRNQCAATPALPT